MIFSHAYEMVTDDIFLALPDLVPECEVFLKVEGLNPAGSIKLKTAVALVDSAEKSGVLKPGGRIIESTSGSLGIALSQVAASRGYTLVAVTDPNASPQSVAFMRALGAQVVIVDRRDANGGFLGTRIGYVRDQLENDPELVWLNQYANPANVAVHAAKTARSLLDELGTVDYLFVGAGTTGTLMGCVQHFRQHSPATKIIAIDAVGSVTFGYPAGRRHIPGLGTSRRPELWRPDSVDDVVLVDEIEAVAMCRSLARTHGVAVGGSTGSVVAAVRRYAPMLPAGSRVAAISPDLGDRYIQTIYNDDWVAARFDLREVDRLQNPVTTGELA